MTLSLRVPGFFLLVMVKPPSSGLPSDSPELLPFLDLMVPVAPLPIGFIVKQFNNNYRNIFIIIIEIFSFQISFTSLIFNKITNLPLQLLVDVVWQPVGPPGGSDTPTAPGGGQGPHRSHLFL